MNCIRGLVHIGPAQGIPVRKWCLCRRDGRNVNDKPDLSPSLCAHCPGKEAEKAYLPWRSSTPQSSPDLYQPPHTGERRGQSSIRRSRRRGKRKKDGKKEIKKEDDEEPIAS